MSARDDDWDMADHTWADRLLAGEPVDDDGGLSGLVSAVLATAERPAPAPSAALALVLREGLPPVTEVVPEQRRAAGARPVLLPASLRPHALRQWSSRTVRVAAASFAATVAMGAGVAAAEVSGVSTLDYVPEPVRRSVDAAVSAVASVFTTDAPAPAQDIAPAPEAPEAPAPATVDDDSAPAPAVPATPPVITPSPSPSPLSDQLGTTGTTPAPAPVEPTTAPSPPGTPSASPSPSPSASGGTREPLSKPTPGPSGSPSDEPSETPSDEPSEEPSGEPSEPTAEPTTDSAVGATAEPTAEPTASADPSVSWDRPEGPRRSVGDRVR